MKSKILISIIIFFILLIIFCVFIAVNVKTEDDKLVGKTEQEIMYLEEKIITIMNKINNISFSNAILTEEKTKNTDENSKNQTNNNSNEENSNGNSSGNSSDNSSKETTKYELKTRSTLSNINQEIDWEYIKVNIESIYTILPNLIMDLHALNVNNEDILKFSNVLDQVTLSAKQEDKIATINNLASLYAFLPNYKAQFMNDNFNINTDYAKTCIINSYALVEQDKWNEMKTQVSNGINYFSNVMNSIEINEKQQNTIGKVYILLNELNNCIDEKDKELYYIKYRNVMEQLNNL